MEENIIKDKHSSQIILSVIVPIYNVEKYIAKCATSLSSQTCSPDKFEVIFVNDGTKDNSISILKDAINFTEHKNFYIIEKENGGLSSARNYGIQHAHGKYIWLIDSDDWIEPDSVSHFLAIINNYNPIIIAQTHYFQETDQTKHIIRFDKEGFIEGPIFCGENHSTCATLYIIKRDFWDKNHFQFKLGIFHEDGELTPRLLYKATQIYVTTKPAYHVLVRPGSITHSINPKRCYDYMTVLNTLYNFYNKEVKTCHQHSFARLMSDHIVGIINLATQVDLKTRNDVNDYLIKNKIFIDILIKSQKPHLVFFSLLLKIWPKPITIYKLLKSVKR